MRKAKLFCTLMMAGALMTSLFVPAAAGENTAEEAAVTTEAAVAEEAAEAGCERFFPELQVCRSSLP